MEGTAQHGVELSERLIRAVARAFYSDNVVVVLDALVSEKYIPENELPVRLQLREKEISRVISQLQRERMIHSEETDGAKCIYIDYRAFVNVVRYRLHVAQKVLQGNEERNVRFQCPSCSSTFSALEVQNMKSKDYKFICSHCCPTLGELRAVKSEPHFTLVGVALESDQRSSVKKLNKQLSAPGPCEPSRDGIFELLRELRTCPLVHNKPSDNRSRGIGPGLVIDPEMRAVLDEMRLAVGRSGRVSKRQREEDEQAADDGTKALLDAQAEEAILAMNEADDNVDWE